MFEDTIQLHIKNYDERSRDMFDKVHKFLFIDDLTRFSSYRTKEQLKEIQDKFLVFENNFNEFMKQKHSLIDSVRINVAVNKFYRNVQNGFKNI